MSDEWRIIFRDPARQQVVEYQQAQDIVSVRRRSISRRGAAAIQAPQPRHQTLCPLCKRPLGDDEDDDDDDDATEDDRASTNTDAAREDEVFMDHNYFRLLSDTLRPRMTNGTETPLSATSRSSSFGNLHSHGGAGAAGANESIGLDANYMNQGYYAKFFREERRLGRGLRGTVFLCRHVMHDVLFGQYAVKKVAVGHNPSWLMRMLEEVHTLEQLQHPNIISYKHAWIENAQLSQFGPEVPCLFILMEFASGGTLDDYLNPPEVATNVRTHRSPHTPLRRFLAEPEIWHMFSDVVAGLHHLHEHNILHRDLKPNNLLLSVDGNATPRVMITDFGESALLSQAKIDGYLRTGNTGTLDFVAPELLLTENGQYRFTHTRASDVWSLGLVLFYLCYGDLPYTQSDDVDKLRDEILQTETTPFNIMHTRAARARAAAGMQPLSPSLLSLMRLILVPKPDERPTTSLLMALCAAKQAETMRNASEPMPPSTAIKRSPQRLLASVSGSGLQTPIVPRPPADATHIVADMARSPSPKHQMNFSVPFWREVMALSLTAIVAAVGGGFAWNAIVCATAVEAMLASQARSASLHSALAFTTTIRCGCLLLVLWSAAESWSVLTLIACLLMAALSAALWWDRRAQWQGRGSLFARMLFRALQLRNSHRSLLILVVSCCGMSVLCLFVVLSSTLYK